MNARVAVVGALDFRRGHRRRPRDAASTRAVGVAPSGRRVYLGDWIEVPVYRLDALSPGEELKGPALFESATTTVLLREGEHARVTPHGWLDISLG